MMKKEGPEEVTPDPSGMLLQGVNNNDQGIASHG